MTGHSNPWRTEPPQPQSAIRVPPVVLGVIAVLVVIHIALWLLGPVYQTWAIGAFAFIPERLGGGRIIPRIPGSEVWTFVTYFFLHADKMHLFTNSMWLLIFSTPVARRLGAVRYLVLLAVTAAAGAAASLITRWGEFIYVIGASASVSGTMAAALPITFAKRFSPQLQTPQQYADLKVLQPMELLSSPRVIAFTLLFLGLTLFSGASQIMTGTAFIEERQIAWEAHLGGFIVGFLAFYLLDRKQRS